MRHALGAPVESSVITQCLLVWSVVLGILNTMHHEEVLSGYEFGECKVTLMLECPFLSMNFDFGVFFFPSIIPLNLFSMPLVLISTPFDSHRFLDLAS